MTANKTKILRVTIVILISLVFIEVIALSSYIKELFEGGSESRNSFSQTKDYPREERDLWFRRIDKIGAELAYEEFKEKYQTAAYRLQHPLSHVFGELLYEKMGVDGLAVCDNTFVSGCFHGFFGTAINSEGRSVFSSLDEFDKACQGGDFWFRCQHGLGHGILSYLGEDRLIEALNICADLPSQLFIGGCPVGVFMEYNLRIMHDLTAVDFNPRPLDPDDPYAPCTLVPEHFQPHCYFIQPFWWQIVLKGDYIKIGKLCNGIEDAILRQVCFRGTGNYIVQNVGYNNVLEIITLCKEMPSFRVIALCMEGASKAFLIHSDPKQRYVPSALCDALEDYNVRMDLCRPNR